MVLEAVYLSGVAYHLGRRMKVEQLDLPESDLRSLQEVQGIRYFRHSRVDVIDLALSSIRKTWKGARCSGEELQADALIFVSNSLSKYSTMDAISRMAKEKVLAKAAFFFVTTGDCCNFQNALALAVSLAGTGHYQNILLVTADRVEDACEGQPLAVYGGGVNSDAAASCLVTVGRGDFRILDMPRVVRHPGVLDVQSESTRLSATLSAVRQVVRSVLPTGTCPADINQIIPNTYTAGAAELIELATSIPAGNVFTDNVGRTGHCFAADNLINLADYAKKSEASGLLILLGSGVFQWGAVALEYAPGRAN